MAVHPGPSLATNLFKMSKTSCCALAKATREEFVFVPTTSSWSRSLALASLAAKPKSSRRNLRRKGGPKEERMVAMVVLKSAESLRSARGGMRRIVSVTSPALIFDEAFFAPLRAEQDRKITASDD
jgi:hypothetical protein